MRTWNKRAIAGLAAAMSLAFAVNAQVPQQDYAATDRARTPVLAQMEEEFVRLGEQIRSYVVNIDATGKLPDNPAGMEGYEDLFRYFFNMPNAPQGPDAPPMPLPNMRGPLRPPVASGSGFIYDKDGHIVTNNHVVQGADKIVVRTSDGKEYPATVVGTDPDTDVAVVKINPDRDLPVAPLGDSDELKVGQFAIAAGSPRGLEGSVSFGHISALGRNELDLPGLRFQDFIQTDAAINLGNSGGPLTNIRGEVVGINTAILAGGNSLGFAIPINTAKRVLPELINKGRVTRGYLGVSIKDADEFVEPLSLPDDSGAFVETVQPNTPAERAGMQPYDVVRKIDGEPVSGRDALVRMISEKEPGSTVSIEVWRDKKPVNLQVTLDEWQPDQMMAQAGGPENGGSLQRLGMTVRPLAPEIAERMGIEAGTKGVLVVDITPGSAAAIAGILPGDVITQIAQQDVATVQDFRNLMTQHAKPGSSVLIRTLTRGGQAITRVMKVPAE